VVAEPIDADEDRAVVESDLDVAGRRAGGVEHRQVGVVVLEEVRAEGAGLLDPARRPTDAFEHGLADGPTELAQEPHGPLAPHTTISSRHSVPPQ
jgi:hypothetical protein